MQIDFAQLLRLEMTRTTDDRVRLSLHNPNGDGQSLVETVIDIQDLERFVRIQGGAVHRDSLVELLWRQEWSSPKREEESFTVDQSPNSTN
jgi:hypothetical protein